MMDKMYLDLWGSWDGDGFMDSICDWCWMEWMVGQGDININEFQMKRENNKGNQFFGKRRKRLMKDRLRKEFKLELGI